MSREQGKDILLGHKHLHAFLHIGYPSGDGFTIHEDGTVDIETYIAANLKTGCYQVAHSATDSIPVDAVGELKQYMISNMEIISKLSAETNNYSCDGAYQKFDFWGVKTSSLNIGRCNPEKFHCIYKRKYDSDYKLRTAIAMENLIVNLFEGAYKILKKYEAPITAQFEGSFYCRWENEIHELTSREAEIKHQMECEKMSADAKIEIPPWLVK